MARRVVRLDTRLHSAGYALLAGKLPTAAGLREPEICSLEPLEPVGCTYCAAAGPPGGGRGGHRFPGERGAWPSC